MGIVLKVLSIVGARPQFVKLAPISDALSQGGLQHLIVHTGQHYEPSMSDSFFSDLSIPKPDVSLGVGSGTHASQTGAILAALEPVLVSEKPDWVLVYGDTNSTLAGAVCTVKLNLRLAHLEAGLRSHNRRMPEEHNRVLTDHASDLLLAPTTAAIEHLTREGLRDKAVLVGDVMVDICLRVAKAVEGRQVSELSAGLRRGEYFAATLHRAENTDDAKRLRRLIDALKALPLPVVIPIHPRLRDRAATAGVELAGGSLVPLGPLSYPEMLMLVGNACSVLTDSGGLQKEAYVLGVPCTTLRTETEWVETLVDDWNVLSSDPNALVESTLRSKPTAQRGHPFGDGFAAAASVAALVGA